ncbi:type VI secretion protein, partial [Streptomyces sp. PSKA30]|nr:type VI secretion protein [Streptomyces sp. PSKA30]
MRPDDHRRDGQGGIPDGLLIGILAFLLGMTLLVWTATGLAGWFSHGAWPSGVSFTRTPLAMRHLVAEPHDITGAWPHTPEAQLSGYGLFWGLFIGQLMVLFVLTVFVMGTLARWKAVRARRKSAPTGRSEDDKAATPAPAIEPQQSRVPAEQAPVTDRDRPHEVPTPRRAPDPDPMAPLRPRSPHAEPATSLFGGERTGGGGWEKILV